MLSSDFFDLPPKSGAEFMLGFGPKTLDAFGVYLRFTDLPVWAGLLVLRLLVFSGRR